MPLFQLYVTPALLLLVLTCPQVSQSVPLMVKGMVTDSLVFSAQILLHNITDALTKDELFSGINCSQEMVKLNNETDTPSVCAPKGSKCSGINKTEFDQDLCLENIGKDLHHYFTFLAAQSDPDKLIDPTLSSLRELMQNFFPKHLPSDLVSEEDASENSSSFDKKLNLCKVLKGFRLRSITINRALSYMNSGEQTK
ncbi:interleukin-12 subunit alpha-like [Gymnodraco acuticeps]|uniref:Interleukin-12 subunit alpha n=1 Tax=Gymnodraco acuticeps TaxID=8218 RepID=A0A6P8T837_GYMAC|nr:interleukin-12 subunit alpha-like [Gymnodraco acuticeps]